MLKIEGGTMIDDTKTKIRQFIVTNFLFDDGEAMLRAVNDSGLGYESAAFRPASLEDVFLKLTGRTLEE